MPLVKTSLKRGILHSRLFFCAIQPHYILRLHISSQKSGARLCLRSLTSAGPSSLELSPMLSSMKQRSSAVMVGCTAGLSYDTKTQNIYQKIPKQPKGKQTILRRWS